jgi:predicted acyl esterase
MKGVAAGTEPAQQTLSGPQTTGRRYESLSKTRFGVIEEVDPAIVRRPRLGGAGAVLEASATGSDTAWILTVQDVGPDGAAHDVTASWLRASMRGVDEERSRPARPVHAHQIEAIPSGESVSYRVGMIDTARRFRRGHRLRVVLRSDDSTGEHAIMGFRHHPLGIPSRTVVRSTSRLVLSELAGTEALTPQHQAEVATFRR